MKHSARILVTALSLAMVALLVCDLCWAQQEGGRQGRPGGRGRPGIGRTGPQPAESSIISEPLAKSEGEKKALEVLKDMFETQRQGMQNVPMEDGRLLRILAESMNAKHVVEIGTSNGYSGIWFCLALRQTGGKLVTHDISPERLKKARENFKRAGVDDLITIVEGDAHETVKNIKEPIDILFLDADKPGYIDYLDKLLHLVKPGGLIIGHNMNRPAPDPKFIEAITTNPELETIMLNMQSSGIGVSLKKR